MTPSARLQATIEILSELERTPAPADRFIREWFRARRYAGSKDRAAVSERVFAILRHRAFLAWRMGSEKPRALVMASALAEAGDVIGIEALFNGDGYGPAPLDDAERSAILSPPRTLPGLDVQGEFPAWLEPELKRSISANLLDEMRALCERAGIDLRVNTLKASREDVIAQLLEAGFVAQATPWSPLGIRLAPDAKLSALSKGEAFRYGLFEFQDEAAQIASLLCAAKPDERILDLAAGAGGKSLALAAMMDNRGEIVACDSDPVRLSQLAPRAARAGASIIRIAERHPPEELFDAVLVDAPCSGTGVWRRQPELRWRLKPERLEELTRVQDGLLKTAAPHVKSGGRLIYATCSMLKGENEDRVAAFLAGHPDFRIRTAADIWRTMQSSPPPGTGEFFHASPFKTGTDGFFAAILARE